MESKESDVILVWNEIEEDEGKLVGRILPYETKTQPLGSLRKLLILTPRSRGKLYDRSDVTLSYDWPATKLPDTFNNLVVFIDRPSILFRTWLNDKQGKAAAQGKEKEVVGKMASSQGATFYLIETHPNRNLDLLPLYFTTVDKNAFPSGSNFTEEEFLSSVERRILYQCPEEVKARLLLRAVEIPMTPDQITLYRDRRALEERLLLTEPTTEDGKEWKSQARGRIFTSRVSNLLYPPEIQYHLNFPSGHPEREKLKYTDNRNFEEGKLWVSKEFLGQLKSKYSPKFHRLLCDLLDGADQGRKQVVYTSLKTRNGAFLLSWILRVLGIKHYLLTPETGNEAKRIKVAKEFNKESSGILLTTVVPPFRLSGVSVLRLVEFRPGQEGYHNSLLDSVRWAGSHRKEARDKFTLERKEAPIAPGAPGFQPVLEVVMYISTLPVPEELMTPDQEYSLRWSGRKNSEELYFSSLMRQASTTEEQLQEAIRTGKLPEAAKCYA